MAAITTTAGGRVFFPGARTSAATLTDWLPVPNFARYAYIHVHITSITTSLLMEFFAIDPVTLDDSFIVKVGEHAAFTAFTTSTADYVFQIGPGITGIADDVTVAAAADSYATINALLPPVLGVRQTNTGSNVYNLTVVFRV